MIPTRPDRDRIRSQCEDRAFKSVVDDIMEGRTVKWGCSTWRSSLSAIDFMDDLRVDSADVAILLVGTEEAQEKVRGRLVKHLREDVEDWARSTITGREAVEERCQQLIEDAGL